MKFIESGEYHIFYVDFSGGPEGVVLRPLGLDEDQVVIMPKDSHVIPAMWTVRANDEDQTAFLFVNGLNVVPAPDGNSIEASPVPRPPHAWFVLQSAPHPPPVGVNAYAIFIDKHGGNAWSPANDATDEKIPVHFGHHGFPFFFQRISHD